MSANAKHNRRAAHNLNYWRFGDYLGIGAGAHGKVTLPDGQIFRTRKTRHPNHYLNTLPEALVIKESIEQEDLPLEFMMNRLRLFETFDLKDYQRYTYQALPDALLKACNTAIKKGFLDAEQWSNGKVQTTEKGKLFLNELLELFLS